MQQSQIEVLLCVCVFFFRFIQLCRERKANRVFNNFEEGHIEFKPTYKYDPGTDDFDTRSERYERRKRNKVMERGGE